MPAYNSSATIRRALQSALDQDDPPQRIVVVDDGSTDDTAAIVEHDFPQVLLLRQHNAGPSAARNTGMAAVDATYVAFLDADDAWHPVKLRLQRQALADHPDCQIVACSWQRSLPSDPVPGTVDHHAIGWRQIARMNAFQTSTAVIGRDLALSVGGFRPQLDGAEDWDFWLRTAMETDTVYLDLPLVLYQDTPTGVSKDLWRVYSHGLTMLADWQERHHRLSAKAFRDLLLWQHLRFAYNFWRLGDSVRARALLQTAVRQSGYGRVARKAATDLMPFLLQRSSRRLRRR